jgi:curved DNA-binding protein CbpA
MAVRDYYSLLSVPRNASLREIEDAYRRLRVPGDDSPAAKDVDRAYETLRDPNQKRKYDANLADGRLARQDSRAYAEQLYAEASPSAEARAAAKAKEKKSAPALSPTTQRAILGALAFALLLVIALSVWPRYAYHFRMFEKGNHLESIHGGEFFGEVLEVEGKHVFPGGRSAPAYLVRRSSGEEQWIPKADLNRLAQIRPKK